MMSRLFVYFRCIIFSAPQLILKATILFWLKYTNLRSVWAFIYVTFLLNVNESCANKDSRAITQHVEYV